MRWGFRTISSFSTFPARGASYARAAAREAPPSCRTGGATWRAERAACERSARRRVEQSNLRVGQVALVVGLAREGIVEAALVEGEYGERVLRRLRSVQAG